MKKISVLLNIDILQAAYQDIGIENFQDTGEEFFVTNVLGEIIGNTGLVLLDIGSNNGAYSTLLFKNFPDSKILSFEPNPLTFKILIENTKIFPQIECINKAVGDVEGYMDLIELDPHSEQASLVGNIFKEQYNIAGQDQLRSYSVEVIALDRFFKTSSLEVIHFLKIDVEGFELNVLKGSINKIKSGSIKVIQFEFNYMNVSNRVFLVDFYALLKDYKLFRIYKDGLIDINQYNHHNEIFGFQNIVAIHHTLEVPLKWIVK